MIGPAPRAKMNQQRQRRYRSVLYRKTISNIKKRLKVHDDNYDWDTNAITPGTKFMEKLAKNLESFLKTSPVFEGLKLYFQIQMSQEKVNIKYLITLKIILKI